MKVYAIFQGKYSDKKLVAVLSAKEMIPPGVLEQPDIEVEAIDLDAIVELQPGESVYEVYLYLEGGDSTMPGADAMVLPLSNFEKAEEWDNGTTHYRVVIASSEKEAIEVAKARYEQEGDINA